MTRLDQQSLETFKRDSIVCLGQIFNEREMAKVRAAMERVIVAAPQGVEIIREGGLQSPVRSVMGWENSDPVLDHFTRDHRVLQPVQSIIGDKNVVFHQTKYNPKAANGEGDKWDPHRGFSYWHFKDGVPRSKEIVSIFVAVTEQSIENGAVKTWKGAHHLSIEELKQESIFTETSERTYEGDTASKLSIQIDPRKMTEYQSKYEEVNLVGPAGTAWLLDSLNLHRSVNNESEKTRILIANVCRSINNVPKHPRDMEYLCGTSTTPLVPYYGEL